MIICKWIASPYKLLLGKKSPTSRADTRKTYNYGSLIFAGRFLCGKAKGDFNEKRGGVYLTKLLMIKMMMKVCLHDEAEVVFMMKLR